jgi:ATP-binding cassette subfamily B protein
MYLDGRKLDDNTLEALRLETAWIDPGVQLWNRSLLDNLCYGAVTADGTVSVADVIYQADLLSVVEALPNGLQTALGESGRLVSGGEGQRVRIGRAMFRPSARLVILDEAFSSIDRGRRQDLLGCLRRLWKDATLLCITHDIADSRSFPRVIVMESGRIVEDGSPEELAVREESSYRKLLESERMVRERIWSAKGWRRLRMERGHLSEDQENRYEHRSTSDLLAS